MRFLISAHMALSVGLLVIAGAAGCSVDRESQLIGKWQGDAPSATFAAVKMKEDSGASTEDAKNAAKILAATFVDFKSDKTFSAGMAGATVEGSWTFNKETGEAILNINTMKGPDGQAAEGALKTWCAYLDDGDSRLAFYPFPAEYAAELKKSKEKGALKKGISLYRK